MTHASGGEIHDPDHGDDVPAYLTSSAYWPPELTCSVPDCGRAIPCRHHPGAPTLAQVCSICGEPWPAWQSAAHDHPVRDFDPDNPPVVDKLLKRDIPASEVLRDALIRHYQQEGQ